MIFITDQEDGTIEVGADFGEKVEPESQAHGMAQVLLHSILSNAKHYTNTEDTAPEVNVEPSKIVLPN
jgi:hypothetical protein